MSAVDVGAARERAQELEDSFSYENYEVVRSELFANLRTPAITIRKDSTTFNQACINGLEDTVYINILVDRTNRYVAVQKCDEDDKDAIRWCIAKDGKRKSRKIMSREFSSRIYDLMGWDKSCRYKIVGYRIMHEGEELFVFVLDEHTITKETKRKTKEQILSESESTGISADEIRKREAEEQKMARRPFYPDDWVNSFGVPVKEHHNISIGSMDDYGSVEELNKKKE